ncbi:MAG: C39 family peptidase [Candidatus Moranbacteria bacterium]|nr:C39 family peptidase [Candidatus Moranbacteria bacterium]
MKKFLTILLITAFALLGWNLLHQTEKPNNQPNSSNSLKDNLEAVKTEKAGEPEEKNGVGNSQETKISDSQNNGKSDDDSKNTSLPEFHLNKAPFLSQSPFAKWDPLHQEACEEAALIMAHLYLQETKSISKEDADKMIKQMVKFEEEELGFDVDIKAKQIIALAEEFYDYKKDRFNLMEKPSVKEIKKELANGNLFIVPAAGRVLENPNFQTPGPLYHALTLTGYDEKSGEFITNDPGTRRGENFRYSYDNLMESIRDLPDSRDKKEILMGEKRVILVKKEL